MTKLIGGITAKKISRESAEYVAGFFIQIKNGGHPKAPAHLVRCSLNSLEQWSQYRYNPSAPNLSLCQRIRM